MARRMTFAPEEWYHCYNRGVDKRDIFDGEDDANRFLMHLYLCNGTRAVTLHDLEKPTLQKALTEDRGDPLVAIGAFCLMSNHYHLLIKEITGDGITSFMRKLGTAYTMYFNLKYDRVGHLFSGPFRSRHVGTDRYFQRVFQYIHFNPAELYERGWKSGKVRNIALLGKKLAAYPYSSLSSYVQRERASPILSNDGFAIANVGSVPNMLEGSREYYAEISKENFER